MKETPKLVLLQAVLLIAIAASAILFVGSYNSSTLSQCAYGGALAFSVATWSLSLLIITFLIEPMNRLVRHTIIRRMDYVFLFGVLVSCFWLLPYFYLYFCIVW